MRIWEISQSPTGSPAPYFVMEWEGEPGGSPKAAGVPVFAASMNQARDVLPRGLVRKSPSKDARQPRGILEIWTEATK
jgi:hypothetical protein